jgi:acyl dehydratase
MPLAERATGGDPLAGILAFDFGFEFGERRGDLEERTSIWVALVGIEIDAHIEDLAVGETYEFGGRKVTKDEIVEFAERYDPQPFHVDEEAARDSMFGGLIASGWHTAAVCMRLFVDGFLADVESAGGSGVNDLRWQKPVRPDDVLSLRAEILTKRPAENAPELGHVNVKLTGVNQNDNIVISWVLLGMIKRRESE